MTTCLICGDTGEVGGMGFLDCCAPSCTAAVDRAALNQFVESEERNFATENDIHWAIHQRATRLAEQACERKYESLTIVVPAVEPSRRMRRSTDK